MNDVYANPEPPRSEIDVLPGLTMLEFGSPTCGICYAAQPDIAEATDGLNTLRHIKIEDGRGRRLGRSFAIKLWPTLVFLKDGQEISRLVRPANAAVIKKTLQLVM
ncbi:MAG: thioredoxin family protein [Pseudomonadota bacterium]